MALLSGTVVVVSGVGPGVGRSIAPASAREGADLVLAARTGSRLDEVAKEVAALGQRAVAVPTDITRYALSDFGLTAEQVDERFAGYHRARA
jgi:NADP-dependent 3-hydroxy acid dehydrogenase YdfG